MGFFKDLKKLSDQSKDLSKGFDPAARMGEASTAMEAAGQMLSQQTEVAQLAVSGEPASAQVNATRDTGQLVNMQPVLEMSLLVFIEGKPPYPATVRQIVPMAQLGRLTPGSRLAVKVDPGKPAAVWIDWAAS
ncbi:MAG: hypothetical protein ABIJ48_11095 [Actinomycetota bacterium]